MDNQMTRGTRYNFEKSMDARYSRSLNKNIIFDRAHIPDKKNRAHMNPHTLLFGIWDYFTDLVHSQELDLG